MSEFRTLDTAAIPTANPAATALSQRAVRSEDILQGAREVLIQHGAETYRLRLTKAGKLILNK